MLLAAITFNIVVLSPEVRIALPPLNDEVLHLANLGRLISAIAFGQDPTDHWLPSIGEGYPLFHYYQHFSYLPPALVGISSITLFQTAPSTSGLLNWTHYLLLSLFPLSIYWSMRRFDFDRLTSVLSALTSSLVATEGLYGFDYNSYVWSGYGLYTQLWGMVLLPPALAQGYVVLKEGRGYFWGVLLLAALLLSHLVLGYIALVSLVILALLVSFTWQGQKATAGSAWYRSSRVILLFALCAVVTAYFFIPFLTENAYLNRSVWEDPGKYNSYGASWVVIALLTGELFDFGRFPSFTLLIALGVVVCLVRRREERYHAPALLFVAWLLLYFGRPTWGALLNLLPMSGDLQLHRFIAGVHLGGIFLLGIGLAAPWRWALARHDARYLVVPVLLTGGLLYPVYLERVTYFEQNAVWMRESQQAIANENRNLTALFDTLSNLPTGRVYAGLAGNWGSTYKIGAIPMYALFVTNGFDTVGYLYHALSLNGDVQVLFDERRAEHYNLFNIRYVVAPVGQLLPDFVKPVRDFGRHRLYEVTTTGYFDLVDTPLSFDGTKGDWYPAASAWLQSAWPYAKLHPSISLDGGRAGPTSALPLLQAGSVLAQQAVVQPAHPGRILLEFVDTDRYVTEVAIDRACMLLLKSTYHPNWRASVDGVETPIVMLMPSYIGVAVSSGQHHIQLEYRPTPWRTYLQIVGLLVLGAVGLIEWQRARLKLLAMRLPLNRWAKLSTIRGWKRAVWAQWENNVVALLHPPKYLSKESTSTTVGFRIKLGIYLSFFAIYFVSAAGHFFTTDHVTVYHTTESLVERGSLDVPPILDTVRGQDGNYYSPFGLGQSLATIPWYLVGKFIDAISTPTLRAYFGGAQLGMWGGTVPIFFVSLFNQFVMPLLGILVFLFCLRFGFTRRTSLLTAFIFGFCTAAWVYARDSFQHPLEAFLLLLSIYTLFVNCENLHYRHALLAGCLLALGILTRINLLLVTPAVAVYLFYLLVTRHISNVVFDKKTPKAIGVRQLTRDGNDLLQRTWRASINGRAVQYTLMFFLPIVVMLAFLMYLNDLRFGNIWLFNAPSQARGFSTPLLFGIYGNLFSVGRSIFLYSPPTLLALFTYRTFYQKHRPEACLFLAVTIIYLLMYSLYGFWEGGWAWGPRFLLPIVPLLILPLGYCLTGGWNKLIVALLSGLGIGVQFLGIVINYSYVYWDWLRMDLSPDNAYLFIPDLSPIAMHARALTEGRHIDLWVLEVYKQFGVSVFFLTILLPLLLLVSAIVLLRGHISSSKR